LTRRRPSRSRPRSDSLLLTIHGASDHPIGPAADAIILGRSNQTLLEARGHNRRAISHKPARHVHHKSRGFSPESPCKSMNAKHILPHAPPAKLRARSGEPAQAQMQGQSCKGDQMRTSDQSGRPNRKPSAQGMRDASGHRIAQVAVRSLASSRNAPPFVDVKQRSNRFEHIQQSSVTCRNLQQSSAQFENEKTKPNCRRRESARIFASAHTPGRTSAKPRRYVPMRKIKPNRTHPISSETFKKIQQSSGIFSAIGAPRKRNKPIHRPILGEVRQRDAPCDPSSKTASLPRLFSRPSGCSILRSRVSRLFCA
jgi:hypothetical protein